MSPRIPKPIHTAPKDHTSFLGFSKQWNWIVVAWGKTDAGLGFFSVPFGWQKIEDLTHWQPLPPQPFFGREADKPSKTKKAHVFHEMKIDIWENFSQKRKP